MPRRYWLPSIALGLILAASAHAQTVRHDARSSASAQQGQGKPQADAPPAIPVAVQNDIHGIAGALDAANKKQPSQKEKDNAARYLQSQLDVAKWARRMFFVGLGEMLITLAGVVLVYGTLSATRKTMRAMVRIERPYLQAVDFSIGRPKLSVYGGAKNHGSRLALVTGFAVLHSREPLPLQPKKPYQELAFTPHVIVAGDTKDWETPLASFFVAEGQYDEMLKTEGPWYFFGYFLYRDAQNVARRSGFAFQCLEGARGSIKPELVVSGPAEYWYDEEA